MIVVDASVAVKWFLPEPLSDAAEMILSGGEARTAPEHILVEVGQALLRSWRGGGISLEHAREAIASLADYIQLVPTHTLATSALNIAAEASFSHDDALYVAASEHLGATLVTADARLHAQLKSVGLAENMRLVAPLDHS